MSEERRTLKLDSSYRPVQIVTAFEAFCMIYMKRANLVEAYDGEFISSAYKKFPVPSVISLNRYIRRDKLTLKCNRKNVFWRDSNTCQYCGNVFSVDALTLDHVTPRSKGGPKSWENIVTCCKRCNQIKGDKLPFQAKMQPLRHPTQPSSQTFHVLERKKIHEKWLPYLIGYKL